MDRLPPVWRLEAAGSFLVFVDVEGARPAEVGSAGLIGWRVWG